MKKYALCLYGKCIEENKYDSMIQYYLSYKYYIKNVLNDNVDVFIHNWHINNNISSIISQKVIKNFKPKKFLFENITDLDCTRSVTLSTKKSVELKNEYANENNINYECVMISEISTLWYKKLDWDIFDNKYFYVPYWGLTNKDLNYSWRECRIQGWKGTGDILFVGNNKDMDTYVSLYDNIDKYIKDGCPSGTGVANHCIKRYHLEKTNLIDKLKFIFIVAMDIESEGICWINTTPGYNNILKKILAKEDLWYKVCNQGQSYKFINDSEFAYGNINYDKISDDMSDSSEIYKNAKLFTGYKEANSIVTVSDDYFKINPCEGEKYLYIKFNNHIK